MEETGLPCLIRGYPFEGVGLPFLDCDWLALGRHAAAALWRPGHRRVAVLTPPDMLQGVRAVLDGVGGLGEPGFQVTAFKENGTPAGIGRVLARALRVAAPPSAIVTTRNRQTVTALTWLTSNGWRVPADVSVVSAGHEPLFDQLVPTPACYRISPEAVARLMVRRLEGLCHGQLHPRGNPWITPDFHPGGSIGPAPEETGRRLAETSIRSAQ